MVSLIIIAVLAVALAVTIFVITHQKKVHAEALAVHAEAMAGEQAYHEITRKAKDYFFSELERVDKELASLKLKIEADAAKLAAEPKKLETAVSDDVKKAVAFITRKKKTTGKKA